MKRSQASYLLVVITLRKDACLAPVCCHDLALDLATQTAAMCEQLNGDAQLGSNADALISREPPGVQHRKPFLSA